jgi:hypothetical protein
MSRYRCSLPGLPAVEVLAICARKKSEKPYATTCCVRLYLVGARRVELRTSSLSGTRSNQLSYAPNRPRKTIHSWHSITRFRRVKPGGTRFFARPGRFLHPKRRKTMPTETCLSGRIPLPDITLWRMQLAECARIAVRRVPAARIRPREGKVAITGKIGANRLSPPPSATET